MAEQNTVDICGNCCYLVKRPEEHPLRQGTPFNLGRSIREQDANELKYRDELIAMQRENIELRKRIHDLQADLAARPPQTTGFGPPATAAVPATNGFGPPVPGFGPPAAIPATNVFGPPATGGFGPPPGGVFAASSGFKF